ncbi:MAG TPA: hypothetical protein PKY31_02085 [Spirochaetota bacterium]|mgnify:CR=1 FL=1|nr:hypothetical protein [Spirochaetota bacterium]
MWSFFKKKHPVVLPASRHTMSNAFVDREVIDILTRLRRSGYEAYLVGGCIRDILLGKKVKDFDIVTGAHPRQIKRLFKRCFLIGKRFRLAHVYISNDRFIEVATFRALVDPEDIPVDGRRYAENNVFGTIEEDALRRDFTINALYYNSADSSIEDYTGGLRDLEKKLLRSIGDPEKKFRDDPVRIIRAGRFCAQLGFRLPRKELSAAVKCAPCITEANANRLLEELYKILRSGASAKCFVNLNLFGILPLWIPELARESVLTPLLKRLAVLDGRRQRGKEISNCVLLTALLFDLFEESGRKAAERGGFQDAFVAIRRDFNDLAVRMRIPKKEWDKVANTAARLWSFTRPANRKWKGENKFVHSLYFQDAIRFFEIYAEATGGLESQLKYWWQRETEAGPTSHSHGTSHPAHPHTATHPHATAHTPRHQAHPAPHPHTGPAREEGGTDEVKKRRRRRRPRRRKPSESQQAPQAPQPPQA